MKEYGVYVKFSNNTELATFGGHDGLNHNVIARTPYKNRKNLDLMKREVLNFVDDVDNQNLWVEQHLFVQRKMFAWVHQHFKAELYEKYYSCIAFPTTMSGSSSISIKGLKKNNLTIHEKLKVRCVTRFNSRCYQKCWNLATKQNQRQRSS